MNERADKDHDRAMDDHTDAKDDHMNIRDDHDDLIIIKTQVGQIKEVIDKLDAKLMGNGKEGLCVTVSRLDQEMKSIKELKRDTIASVAVIIAVAMLVIAGINIFI